jgi:hypothetical protein
MNRLRNTHHCRECKRGDELYFDSHGIFCHRCGPSVPVDSGIYLGDATVIMGDKNYMARNTVIYLEDVRPAAHKSPKPGRHTATIRIP